MTTPSSSPDNRRHRDDGAAMIITMMVIALVGVLATTVLSTTIGNLGSTRRAEDSALALDAADAGLTQTIVRLRAKGVRALTGTLPACTEDGWKTATPLLDRDVPGSSAQHYKTWVAVCPVSAEDPRTKVLKVTSQGTAYRGARVVQETVTLTPRLGFPLGIFARTFQGGGSADYDGVSVFSTGCVWNRSKIHFSDTVDAAYKIRTAVHSSKIITDSNGNTANCSVDNRSIHHSTKCPSLASGTMYDQDSIGGPCPGLPTSPSQYLKYYGPHDNNGDGVNDSVGTYVKDDATLLDLYDIEADPFPKEKLDELKVIAQQQGTYYTSATTWTVPSPTTNPDAIVYFDLQGTSIGGTVDLNRFGTTWAQTSSCLPQSLLIIIDNGNADMNSNKSLAANVVLTSKTYGNVDKVNGTADFLGTVYANSVNATGNFSFKLNDCFLSNLSPYLFAVQTSAYVELDR